MESFLDMTLDRNLYIGVPVGAFLCSLFLLFCFFNTMKSRTVRSLRAVLTSCLVWSRWGDSHAATGISGNSFLA